MKKGGEIGFQLLFHLFFGDVLCRIFNPDIEKNGEESF
jgi:hypothetical protein